MRMIELTKVETTRFNDNEEGEGQPRVTTAVQADSIRCMYPRKGGKPGTRITFTDGGGFVVTESYAVIKALLIQAKVIFHTAPTPTATVLIEDQRQPETTDA